MLGWLWRQREREPTAQDLDRLAREQHADRVIKRIDAVALNLERVVDELNVIARRFPHVEE